MNKKQNVKLVVWIEGAIIAGVAMALSFIPIEAPNAAFDLSLGMIPVTLYALRRGTFPAILVGMVWGLLHLVLGRAYILTPIQAIFEYPFAFAFAGMAGLFSKKFLSALSSKSSKAIIFCVCIASIVGTFARWFWHFWAGVLVWGSYAPEGMNPYLYSFIFNGASFIANALMLCVVIYALTKISPRLFRVGLS